MADEMKNDEENFAEMLAGHEAQDSKLQMGQKIKGKIITISGDDVFLDIGIKEDGVMDKKDLLDARGEIVAAPGDEVEGFVTSISSQGVKISRSMSGGGIAALEDAKEAGLPVEGRVKGPCKGGYQIDILGKTAFCPGSQMEQAQDGEDLTGRQMLFLITRIENHGRNLVVSHRALVERERQESLDKLLASVNVGDIVEGKVTRLARFGAFVEIAPFVEGMVHISELSWSHITTPEEAVAPDEIIKVKILETGKDDKNRLRISLSRKQAMGDPWDEIGDKFKPGDVVEGTVRRLAPFGAFVEIAPGIEGLVHLSEMSWEKRINKAEDALSQGEKVQVKIKEINPETKRVSLSLRDALGDPWAMAGEKLVPGTKISGKVESRGQYGIFVSLLPGITGLLPLSAIKNSPLGAQINKLSPGDDIQVSVQKTDIGARRISLVPVGGEETVEEDKSWREHVGVKDGPSGDMGIMAQALNKALQKKGGHKA